MKRVRREREPLPATLAILRGETRGGGKGFIRLKATGKSNVDHKERQRTKGRIRVKTKAG